MDRKGFAAILIIVFIIVLLIGGALVSYRLFLKSTETTKGGKFTNQLVGYGLTYDSLWRIASEYSKYWSTLKKYRELSLGTGCEAHSADGKEKSKEEIDTCLSKYPQLDAELRDYQINWKPETSEFIGLTDLSLTDELAFMNDVKANKRAVSDPPRGHFIDIYPSDLDPTNFKEGHAGGLEVKAITLSDGTRAEWSSWLPGVKGSHIRIDIPHTFAYKLLDEMSALETGKSVFVPAKSLEFQTDSDEGSAAVQELANLANSINFNNL